MADAKRLVDRAIQQEVADHLAAQVMIQSTDAIGVAVDEGVVTLTGTVSSYEAKWAAEWAVATVPDVRAIADNLIVQRTGVQIPTNTEIAKATLEALECQPTMAAKRLDLRVEQDGRVYLRGAVDQEGQRVLIEEVVRGIAGVSAVVNLLSIQPPPPTDSGAQNSSVPTPSASSAAASAQRPSASFAESKEHRMFPRLLVPLDGSPTAAQVIPMAMTLAHALDSEVRLLSVVEPVPTWSSRFPTTEEAAEQAHTLAAAYLEQVAADLQRDGITTTAIVQQGHPAQMILAAAAELDCSLIVLASHGHSGLAHLRLGSVAQQVVRHAPIPTLVVRARAAGGLEGATISAITVTLDGSAEAEQALPVATALADALVVPLTLLTVLPNLIGAYPWVTYLPTIYLPTPEQDQADEEAVRAYLKATAGKLQAPGREIQTSWLRSLTNRVDQAIIDYLANQPRGLVVMASHGRGGVRRWVLGSTAEAVLPQVPGAVLIVPVNLARSPAQAS